MTPTQTTTSLQRAPAAFSQDDVHAELMLQLAELRAEVEALRGYRAIAYQDVLTGLRNRRYLEKRLEEEVSRVRRGGADARLSLVYVDLDDFKRINDELGHAAGDATLRWVADVLGGAMRVHDVLCRVGGDEFVLVCPGADEADCEIIISRLRAHLLAAGRGRVAPVDASMGSATWSRVLPGADALLAHADKAMYAVKAKKHARRAR